ncbi:tRNA pseudouridine(38-40) synthase TruA [Hydrogenimonas sp.]
MRIKAVIAYDGSHFFGFQSQKTTPHTITGRIETAAKKLGIHSPVVGSGRTDRNVHATGQVIHFDLPEHWQEDLKKLKIVFNRLLQPSIQIKTITPVHDTFHARFDAKRRIYRYVLKSIPTTPFENAYCTYIDKCDMKKLEEALHLFRGTHDFSLFHKKGSDPGSTVRTIWRSEVRNFKNYTILYLEANGFLRAQVRMLAGAAIRYAQGGLSIEQIERQLAGKQLFTTYLAPPQGLYLARVTY